MGAAFLAGYFAQHLQLLPNALVSPAASNASGHNTFTMPLPNTPMFSRKNSAPIKATANGTTLWCGQEHELLCVG